jgi:ribonuclease H-related protein
MKFIAATDGSHNRGKFGWGFAVTDEKGTLLVTCYGSGIVDPAWAHGWNIASECTAVIRLLESIKPGVELEVLHDYEGVGKWARGEWKAKTPVSSGYIAELKRLRRNVKFTWVKGHAGHALNETVDQLAYKGLTEQPATPVIVKANMRPQNE